MSLMLMGDVRMHTVIIDVFKEEKKETLKQGQKHFRELQELWLNNGPENVGRGKSGGYGKIEA